MVSMKKWIFGAALAVGTLALSAAPARAARIGVVVGVGAPVAPVAYVPPCPGPGYVWANGYWANGYWVPGYWNFVGVRVAGPIVRGGVVVNRGPVVYRGNFSRRFAPERFRR